MKFEILGRKIPYESYENLIWIETVFFALIVESTRFALCAVFHPYGHPVWEQIQCYVAICAIPNIVTTFNTNHFINLTILLSKLYEETNIMFKLSVHYRGAQHHYIRSITDLYADLNDISKQLSTFYGNFLLAAIASQFIMALNLLYNLFLFWIGALQLSLLSLMSTIFWIILQFAFLFGYVYGVEKILMALKHTSQTILCSHLGEFHKIKNVRH